MTPTLDGYEPTWTWQNQSPTPWQLGYLEGLGLIVKPGLTRGEAAYLIAQCKRYEEEYPLPATAKQKWFLRSQGLWRDGISKREATNLIAEIKRQEQSLVGRSM